MLANPLPVYGPSFAAVEYGTVNANAIIAIEATQQLEKFAMLHYCAVHNPCYGNARVQELRQPKFRGKKLN